MYLINKFKKGIRFLKEKEKLKNFLKWGKFSFYVMVDRETFTYLKNKNKLTLIVNKKFKISDF